MADNKFLEYKGKPLVRKGNEIYYGDMTQPFVVRFEILLYTKEEDIEKASEYAGFASALLYEKSKALLPRLEDDLEFEEGIEDTYDWDEAEPIEEHKVKKYYVDDVEVEVVDVQPGGRRHGLLRPHEGLVRIIRRHGSIVAAVERLATHSLPSEYVIVSSTLVHDIPRIDATSIARAYFADAAFVDRLLRLQERRDEFRDLLVGKAHIHLLPRRLPRKGPFPVAGTDLVERIRAWNHHAAGLFERALLGRRAEAVP